jgi:hypothetical protein
MGAVKVKADGFTFDSKAEYERYLILKQLLHLGVISDLQIHRRFDCFIGKKLLFFYKVDFTYIDKNGQERAEEVKGMWTSMGRLKVKWFRLAHPEIPLSVIIRGKVVE